MGLFRQYFFDLGTFLGESVEHIWLAPGTTIEPIEVSTRKTTIERSEESAQETTTRAEQSIEVKDELSDAVTAHKENREQAEKLSSEIKRSFKSVFKMVTEATDTRSRRYVLQNPSANLLDDELRRKMRRVGV